MTNFSIFLPLFCIFAVTTCTENYMDYSADENADHDLEGLREFYRFLLRHNTLDNSIENYPSDGIPYEHLMIRKSQRSPSLRLRFGRSAPAITRDGPLRLGSSPRLPSDSN